MTGVVLGRLAVEAPRWPIAVQLARHEGMRLIRHPVFLVGGLLSLAVFGLLTWEAAPVLHRDDTSVPGALFPLAAATLIVANLAASRSTRDGTDELFDGTAASVATRTVGHLLSLAFAAGAAGALVALMFVYMLVDVPVGTPRVAEIVTGPVIVVLLGAVGTALARWKPHPALGPIAVVVLIAFEILLIQPIIGPLIQLSGSSVGLAAGGLARRIPWFAPWVPMSLTREVPPELVIRPAGWHLLYLSGLTVLFGGLAVAPTGSRRPVTAVLIAGVVGTAVGSAGQLTPPTGAQQAVLVAFVEEPEQHQVCEERRGITYCAYEAYVPWIDRWAKPIDAALDRIPPEARPEGLVVRQTFGSYFGGPTDLPPETLGRMQRAGRRPRAEGAIPTFSVRTDWGRGGTEGEYEIGLAMYVAIEAVGLPSARAEVRLNAEDVALLKETWIPTIPKRLRGKAARHLEPGFAGWCQATGQARAMVAWWLAVQATPATRATAERVAAESPYGLRIFEVEGKRVANDLGPFTPLRPPVRPPIWDRVNLGDSEFYYAVELLQRPTDRVASFVAQHWDDLTVSTAPTESFLDELGIARHPTIEEQIAALPRGVELEEDPGVPNRDDYRVAQVPCL